MANALPQSAQLRVVIAGIEVRTTYGNLPAVVQALADETYGERGISRTRKVHGHSHCAGVEVTVHVL